jgi:transcriptional regulator with XRE-family HTH domain
VSLSNPEPRLEAEAGFPRHLRDWRQKRRLSQLDLALAAGVSQRHVSFLESGRANPSRSMILQLSETLEVPLRDRNAWLTAAGFAPVFRTRVDWYVGFAVCDDKAAARLYNIGPAVA